MSDAPGVAPIVVLPVQPGEPPFRVVEIEGQTVGIAHDMIDVISLAHASGRHGVDLDDPALVRWVGGGKYRWKP